MSLEAKLEELTAAVSALTAIMSSAGSGSATVASKTADKPTADKPARTPRASAKTKAPSVKELTEVATKFLDEAEGNEDAYAARRGLINDLRGKFEIKKLSDAAEDDRQAIIDAIKAFADENAVGEEGDGEDDAGI